MTCCVHCNWHRFFFCCMESQSELTDIEMSRPFSHLVSVRSRRVMLHAVAYSRMIYLNMIIVHRGNFIPFLLAWQQLMISWAWLLELSWTKNTFLWQPFLKLKIIETPPSTSTKWTWKQSKALRGMVITRYILEGRLLHAALASRVPAANEECVRQRGGKHCRNSPLSVVTITDFYAVFIPYFTFLYNFEIFEHQHHLCLSLSKGKCLLDKINKIKHRLSWIRCNIHMEDNIYNIKHISRPILTPIQ